MNRVCGDTGSSCFLVCSADVSEGSDLQADVIWPSQTGLRGTRALPLSLRTVARRWAGRPAFELPYRSDRLHFVVKVDLTLRERPCPQAIDSVPLPVRLRKISLGCSFPGEDVISNRRRPLYPHCGV